jgi:hypothetical protein
MIEWSVVCEPRSPNREGDGTGGVVVYLMRETTLVEVSRVGFVRSQTADPDTAFQEKLVEVVDRAQEAADTINDLMVEHQRLIDLADEEATARIREIFSALDEGAE